MNCRNENYSLARFVEALGYLSVTVADSVTFVGIRKELHLKDYYTLGDGNSLLLDLLLGKQTS